MSTESKRIIAIIVAILGVVIFFAIPRTKEYNLTDMQWVTEINIEEYKKVRRTDKSHKEPGAYNVVTHRNDGKTTYSYNVNKWVSYDTLQRFGHVEEPIVEPDCKYELNVPEELGNKRRTAGYTTYYQAILTKNNGNRVIYKITAEDWNKYSKEISRAKVRCKKFILGNTIRDIEIISDVD